MTTPADGQRVLLVDGSGSLEPWLATALGEAGCDVTVVASGASCLRRLDDEPVDAVVTEQSLPTFDGRTLVRSIRISRPALPVVLAPADGDGVGPETAFAAGATGYVPRSAGPAAVVDVIERSPGGTHWAGANEHHHRYRHLVDISPAPINVFDEDGETIWGNDAVVALLGLDGRDELVGRSIFEFIHPDDRTLARAEVEAVIEAKRSVGPTRMRLVRADGEVRHVLIATAVGRFLGADVGQAIVVDRTEEVQRHRQLQILENWLRHNVRNEMNVITGVAAEIAAGRTADVPAAARSILEHADGLLDQVETERRLIELLTAEPTPVELDVTAVVAEQVDAIRRRHDHATVAFDAAGDCRALALPELEQAVGELLENAVRHSDRDEPTVSVEVTRSDGDGPGAEAVTVRVADDGPGIPASERAAFDPEAVVDQLSHGTGVGLVAVHWIVRLSGGTVDVAANGPRGTVVTVALPAAPSGAK